MLSGTTPERYRRALLGDDMFFIGLPMLLVAFVTLLVSHSLFPDEKDFRILGPLPERRHVVVGAKFRRCWPLLVSSPASFTWRWRP